MYELSNGALLRSHTGCRFDVKFNIVFNCPINYEQPLCKMDFILLQTKKVVEIWVCFEVQFQCAFCTGEKVFSFQMFSVQLTSITPIMSCLFHALFHVLVSDWEASRVCGTCQCHIRNKPSLRVPQCPPDALKQLSMIPDRAAHCWDNKTFIFVVFFLDTLTLILHSLMQPQCQSTRLLVWRIQRLN